MVGESSTYSRGQLAKLSGVKAETIRYYESIGLLPAPERGSNNYRLYGQEHLSRLRFIRHTRELGFDVAAVRDLLTLDGRNPMTCREVKQRTQVHIDGISQKIKQLQQIQRHLRGLVNLCDQDDLPACPILDVLAAEFESGVEPVKLD